MPRARLVCLQGGLRLVMLSKLHPAVSHKATAVTLVTIADELHAWRHVISTWNVVKVADTVPEHTTSTLERRTCSMSHTLPWITT